MSGDGASVSLFLAGDVMLGRGIDQIMPRHCEPVLHEAFADSALDYVALAERASGHIPRAVAPAYVWGDALAALAEAAPAARIVNLETSITTSDAAEPKGVNYRMHPENVAVLRAADIECAVLANNHVGDWGEAGLLETVDTLAGARIGVAGAGRDLGEARAPAVIPVPGGRVLVFGIGAPDCGIPNSWAAATYRPGVHLLRDLSPAAADDVIRLVDAARRPGDIVVVSIHWGSNWGWEVPREHRRFAHALIDGTGADVVHGHSSHHPRPIEIHAGKPILYGCGDLVNDYEGIRGHEEYRGELGLMYLPTLDAGSGRLLELRMIPMRIRRLRLEHASAEDRAWLRARLDRESRAWGTAVVEREAALFAERAG